MKCPVCKKEMEKGFLCTNGMHIVWDKTAHKIAVRPGNDGVRIAFSMLSCANLSDVYCCKECQQISFHYEPIKK